MRKKSKTIAELFAEIENTPIAIAVRPLRDAAIKEAEKRAKEKMKHVAEDLTKAGNDINIAAPYPDRSITWFVAAAMQNTRSLYDCLTERRPDQIVGYRSPCYVDMSKKSNTNSTYINLLSK